MRNQKFRFAKGRAAVCVFTIVAAVLLSGCLLFSSPPKIENPPEVGDIVTLVIGQGEQWQEYDTLIEEGIGTTTLGNILDSVVSKNNLTVEYWNEQTDDRFIVKMGDLNPNIPNNEYIFCLANDSDPYYTGGMNIQVDYHGDTYFDLNQGFDQTLIRKGVKYMFTIVQFQLVTKSFFVSGVVILV